MKDFRKLKEETLYLKIKVFQQEQTLKEIQANKKGRRNPFMMII